MRLRILAIVLVSLAAHSARADLDAGIAAFERRDCSTADRELRPVAEKGNALAQRLMGMLAFRCGIVIPSGYRPPEERAIAEGRADAAARLSFEYDWIIATPRDPYGAVQWFAKAAANDDAVAQFVLASFLDRGLVVAQDHAAAVTWLRRAAACDDVGADYFLAIHYRDGIGVALDKGIAFQWFRTAAERGDVNASAELGRIYLQGDGISPDYAEALKWLTAPAELEHGPAQYYLGTMYRDGLGATQDLVQAYKWLFLAKRAGLPVGIAESYQDVATRDWLAVSDRMTPSQIGEAIKLVSGWIGDNNRGRSPFCRKVGCCRR
ncbi:MAG TPA: tetratricopeptide repeat protein [Candidatus Acidoferrum sp.]|nr:tetratricopeptide repeat protein [Candidatus Acidoferrum sp.]